MRTFQVATFWKDGEPTVEANLPQNNQFCIAVGKTVCTTPHQLWNALADLHQASVYSETKVPPEATRDAIGPAVERFLAEGGTVSLFRPGEGMKDPNEELTKTVLKLLKRDLGSARWQRLSPWERMQKAKAIVQGKGNDKAQAILEEAKEILSAEPTPVTGNLSLEALGL